MVNLGKLFIRQNILFRKNPGSGKEACNRQNRHGHAENHKRRAVAVLCCQLCRIRSGILLNVTEIQRQCRNHGSHAACQLYHEGLHGKGDALIPAIVFQLSVIHGIRKENGC